MQYNLSPETLVGVQPKNMGVENYLNEKFNLQWARDKNVTVAPNGSMYRRDKQGFLPELMEKMYGDRVVFKKKTIEAKKNFKRQKILSTRMRLVDVIIFKWQKRLLLTLLITQSVINTLDILMCVLQKRLH